MEQRYLGLVLISFLGAILLGVLVTDPKHRLKLLLGAALLFVIFGMWFTDSIRTGFVNGIFLFILVFLVPFQWGCWLAKRANKKKV